MHLVIALFLLRNIIRGVCLRLFPLVGGGRHADILEDARVGVQFFTDLVV